VIGVATAFGLLARRRADYRVVRKLEIGAPPEVIFGALNDLQQFASVLVLFGSTLKRTNPGLQLKFDGPSAGVGQSFAWASKEAGEGTLTINESVPAQKVGLALEFVRPMASKALYVLTLERTPAGSSVTWSMDGKHNFLGKAFDLLMDMDKALGNDLEKGLAQLKSLTEGR
jgi:hypothetical protein